MSQKRQRGRRAFEALATEAHNSVHLLIELGGAITQREAASECHAQAAALGHALRRALQHWPITRGNSLNPPGSVRKAEQTHANPSIPGVTLGYSKAIPHE